jgi:hypothetical protein
MTITLEESGWCLNRPELYRLFIIEELSTTVFAHSLGLSDFLIPNLQYHKPITHGIWCQSPSLSRITKPICRGGMVHVLEDAPKARRLFAPLLRLILGSCIHSEE